jgi:glycosyltransferase involved in cell wall biosynthesis
VLVHVVDPAAYTPPYDDALCRALAAAGADVELLTAPFAHGATPPARGYRRREVFYRAAAAMRGARLRRLVRLAEHVPEMLAYRRAARAADVVHFQWLPIQPLDVHLLPRRAPVVLTAHDVLPREPRPGQLAAQRRLYQRVDAVVVHTDHGRQRLLEEVGVPAERVHVIPHGVLEPPAGEPGLLPPELHDDGRPVVLFFGLIRPYKGLDLLLEAWREVAGAQLWIAGMPRIDLAELRSEAPPGVQWVTRYVTDAEMAGLLRRADLLVLPYREIDQSGVAFAGLGAGTPLLLSDAGGFPELAATGAARLFPAGDARALGAALTELLADPAALAAMGAAARAAAAGERSWTRIAALTLELYAGLGAR